MLLIYIVLSTSVLFSEGNKEKPDQQESLTIISLWPKMEYMEMASDIYSETGISIKYLSASGSYEEKLQHLILDCTAGKGPDIVISDVSTALILAEKKAIISLEGIFDKAIVEQLAPETVDAFKFNNELYGIPSKYHTLALFYNENIFNECKIAKPTFGWTWNDVILASEKCVEQASIPGLMVSDDFTGFYSCGFTTAKLTPVALTEKKDLSTWFHSAISEPTKLKSYIDWRKNGLIIAASDIDAGWGGQGFVNGKAAMAIEGTWLINYIDETAPQLKYNVVPLPMKAEKSERSNLIYVDGYQITKGAAKRDNVKQARDLIEYLISEEFQRKWYRIGLGMPANISLREELDMNAIYKGGVVNANPYYFVSPFAPVFNYAVDKAIKEKTTPDPEAFIKLLNQLYK